MRITNTIKRTLQGRVSFVIGERGLVRLRVIAVGEIFGHILVSDGTTIYEDVIIWETTPHRSATQLFVHWNDFTSATLLIARQVVIDKKRPLAKFTFCAKRFRLVGTGGLYKDRSGF